MIALLAGLTVLASTSDIEYVLSHLGDGIFEVREIVPGGMCPGHFDLSPRDAYLLTDGDILISHGWEGWLKKVEKLESHPEIYRVKTKGNWMVPCVMKVACDELYILMRQRISDSVKLKKLEQNRNSLIELIDSLDMEIKHLSSPLKGIRVVCNEFVKDQLEYLGMEVVKTFPSGSDVTPENIKEVLNTRDVKIIVENLQSVGKTGEVISREMQIPLVVISNFPLNNDYQGTMIRNVKKLLEILSND
ncbi:zinc ABC transporter substrate-binding protein [candidate division WOR-3 bacterium]|nr:zinc ABC transporter substrate-binding protein [candidate division WOR-3 bacterium]